MIKQSVKSLPEYDYTEFCEIILEAKGDPEHAIYIFEEMEDTGKFDDCNSIEEIRDIVRAI